MRRFQRNSMMSLIGRPLSVVLLLLGLFGLVWLRSSVTAVTYNIRDLEEKRTAEFKESKALLAERSKLMALSTIDYSGQRQSDRKLVSGTYVFPDRIKVVNVTRTKGPEAYKATYPVGERH